MSTIELTANQVAVQAAALLNDPAMTDYNYTTMMPYMNMAIFELNETLEEYNFPITNQVSQPYPVVVGNYMLTNLPHDLVEIQEVGERQSGTDGPFITLPRREFPDLLPPTNSLLYWFFQSGGVRFNPNGATTKMEVQLKYVARPFKAVQPDNEITVIGNINAASFLSYKTAALCARFIGENESRAAVLEMKANEAMERFIGISNKGKQQIMTRHRPFRAGYKARGY